MRAKIGDVEVEGTAEEIGALIRSLGLSTASTSERALPAASDDDFVSEEVAFKALKRRSLSPEQTQLLKALLDAGEKGASAADLQKITKYSPSQLAGLLGAFGKRVSSTEGYAKGSYFFRQSWDYEEDCYRYWLPPPSLNAVKRVLV